MHLGTSGRFRRGHLSAHRPGIGRKKAKENPGDSSSLSFHLPPKTARPIPGEELLRRMEREDIDFYSNEYGDPLIDEEILAVLPKSRSVSEVLRWVRGIATPRPFDLVLPQEKIPA